MTWYTGTEQSTGSCTPNRQHSEQYKLGSTIQCHVSTGKSFLVVLLQPLYVVGAMYITWMAYIA